MLIDFRQFLYDSVVKVLIKTDSFFFFFFFFFCMTEMRWQALAHNLNIQYHMLTYIMLLLLKKDLVGLIDVFPL